MATESRTIIIDEPAYPDSRTALVNVVEKFRQDYLPVDGTAEKALDISGYQVLQKLLLYQGYERLEICKSKVKTADGSRPGNLWARSRGNGTIDVLLEERITHISRHSGYTYIEFSSPAEYARFLREYIQLPLPLNISYPPKFPGAVVSGGLLGVGAGIGITTLMQSAKPLPNADSLVLGGVFISLICGAIGMGIGRIISELSTPSENKSAYNSFYQTYGKEMYGGAAENPLSRALGLLVPEKEKPAQ